jgi:hypothetical protein
MKQTISAFFISFIALKLVAQDSIYLKKTPEKFFTTGIGATWQNRYDDVFTPLTHSGIGAELHLGSEKISEKWYKKLDIWGGFNDMKSRVDKGYNSPAYGIRYGVSQIWAKRFFEDSANTRKTNIYIGGQLFHESSMGVYNANINNIFSYNAPTGFAAAAYVNRKIHFFKRDWVLSSQLTLPILAYNARPSFIGFVDWDNLRKDYGIVTLNKLVNLDWRWQLDLPLPNSNRLRLAYRWSFLNDTHVGHLQMGAQGLLVESLFNIPYKVKSKDSGKESFFKRIFKKKPMQEKQPIQ